MVTAARPQMPGYGVLPAASAAASRKVRNLAAEPRCTVTIDDANDPVVIDGTAEVCGDEPDRRRFLKLMNAKYTVKYGLDFLDGVAVLLLRVQPVTAFGLLQADFAGSPTRWTFDA